MTTVLITGANRGIGLEFASQYAAAGWDVLAAVRHTSDDLDKLSVGVVGLDLADPQAVARFAETIDRPIDLYIANAGVSEPKMPADADDARSWQDMLLVNCIAPYMIGHALLPRMREGGKMIAISSGMGSISDNGGGWVPYRTSKAALNMAWSCLSMEAKAKSVSVVSVSPGWVKTRMGGSGAEITAEQSVTDLCALIDRIGIKETGSFLSRDGTPLAW